MEITLAFELGQATLPSPEQHLRLLLKVAKVLEPFGLPIEEWYPPARTPKLSLAHPAFAGNEPTPIAVERLRAKDRRLAMETYRITSVWDGKRNGKGCSFSISLSTDSNNPRCVFSLQSRDVDVFNDAENMRRFMIEVLKIWPAALLMEAGPLRYYTEHRVFPKCPGAGWMFYLPKIITADQLPEAASLVPVMDAGVQRGTIIVSVADETFSVSNPDHIKTANAIEVRLADQGLLRRWMQHGA